VDEEGEEGPRHEDDAHDDDREHILKRWNAVALCRFQPIMNNLQEWV
jgi:hypothetical protein